jgi:prepilin-type N-terminal cleavage/methylation domain-containing protein
MTPPAPAPGRDERGFTLVELLIACATLGILLAGAVMAVQAGLATSRVGTGKVEAAQNVRTALERMVREIRTAGYDPRAANFSAVTAQTGSSVTIQLDRNGNGVIDAPAAPCDANGEQVRFQLVGSQIVRSSDPGNAGCDQALADGVVSLAFTYLDATGVVTGTAAAVRTVTIAVTSAPAGVAAAERGPMTASMQDRVSFRNR